MEIFWRCILYSLVLMMGSLTDTEVKEDARVKWNNDPDANDGSDMHPSLPDKVYIEIEIDGRKVTLNLTKDNSVDVEEVPVILGEKKGDRKWSHDEYEQMSAYTDKAMYASFSVVTNKKNGKTFTEYFGNFAYNDTKYSLIQKSLHEQSGMSNVILHTFALNGTDYVVYKDDDQMPRVIADDEIADPNVDVEVVTSPNDSVLLNEIRKPRNGTALSRRRRATNMNLVVDLMIIVDYSMFTKFLKINKGNRKSTIKEIRYHLAHIINGVNMIYSTLLYPRLSVKAVGIYIAETRMKSIFTEAANAHPDMNRYWKINSSRTLRNFAYWINDWKPEKGNSIMNENSLAKYDVAALFTDYHEYPVMGVAYIGVVCQKEVSVSLIHDRAQFDTISTAAHELAHVLGSDHDDWKKGCPENEYYLMSPTSSSSNLENRYKLSNCTVKYVTRMIGLLESEGTNCLNPTWTRSRDQIPKTTDCKHGDQEIRIRYENRIYGCELVKIYPTSCDTPSVAYHCCESCRKVKHDWKILADLPNGELPERVCIYGDKGHRQLMNFRVYGCQDASRETSLCSIESFSSNCCESCRQK